MDGAELRRFLFMRRHYSRRQWLSSTVSIRLPTGAVMHRQRRTASRPGSQRSTFPTGQASHARPQCRLLRPGTGRGPPVEPYRRLGSWRDSVVKCGSPLPPWESAGGLAHSKTSRGVHRVMEVRIRRRRNPRSRSPAHVDSIMATSRTRAVVKEWLWRRETQRPRFV